jgi:hypothetical protein
MPTLQERRDLADAAAAMAVAVASEQLPEIVRSSLPKTLYDYLLNVELAVLATQHAVFFQDLLPGFSLLVLKSQNWNPETYDLPTPIPEDAVSVVEDAMRQIAEAILPEGQSGLYQHWETSDGLICALFRTGDQHAIFAAAGIDPASITPADPAFRIH